MAEDESSSSSVEVFSGLGRVGVHERIPLRGCGRLFFTAGYFDKYKRPRWSHSPQHLLAQAAGVLGLFHLSNFPNTVAEYGGVAFLLVYLIVNALLGFPILTLEILLGQFSGRNTVEIFRRLCPLSAGAGWATVFVSLCKLIVTIPVLGMILLGTLTSFSQWFTCTRMYGTIGATKAQGCYDYYAKNRCEGRAQNTSRRHVYLKGICFESADEFLAHLDNCLQKERLYSHYAQIEAESRPMDSKLQQLNRSCGFDLEFRIPALRKTSWFRRYNNSHFLIAKEACSHRRRGYWILYDRITDPCPLRIRLQLLPDISRTIFHSPYATAQRLSHFLTTNRLRFSEMVREYCNYSSHKGSLWSCVLDDMTIREQLPSSVYFAHSITNTKKRFWEFETLSALATMTMWVIVFIPVIKGPEWIAKTVLFTSYMPFFSLLALLYHGCWTAGFWEGVFRLLRPEWCRVLDPYTWYMAVYQNMCNIPVGMGVVPVLSSYGSYEQDGIGHAVAVSLWSFGFALLSTVILFGYMGIASHILGRRIDELANDMDESMNFMLSFDINVFHYTGHFFSVSFLYMGTCVIVGLSACFCIYESAIAVFTEHMPYLSQRRPMGRVLIAVIVSLVCCIFSIPGASPNSATWVDRLVFIVVILSLSNVLATLLCVCYVYGLRQWSADLCLLFVSRNFRGNRPWLSNLVWRSPLRRYLQVTWAALPVFLALLCAWALTVAYHVDHNDSDKANQDNQLWKHPDVSDKVNKVFKNRIVPIFCAIYFVVLISTFLVNFSRCLAGQPWGSLCRLFRVGRHWLPVDPIFRAAYLRRGQSETEWEDVIDSTRRLPSIRAPSPYTFSFPTQTLSPLTQPPYPLPHSAPHSACTDTHSGDSAPPFPPGPVPYPTSGSGASQVSGTEPDATME